VVNRGPRTALEQGRWHDTFCSESSESEFTPPLITQLCNIYLQKHHDLGSYYSILTLRILGHCLRPCMCENEKPSCEERVLYMSISLEIPVLTFNFSGPKKWYRQRWSYHFCDILPSCVCTCNNTVAITRTCTASRVT